MGWLGIGRAPGRTGQPAFGLVEAAVKAVMPRSGVEPLPPMSCRYFGQSAALAPTPAADDAAVASRAAAAALMKNGRRCFNVPPGLRQTAVVADGLPQPLGPRRRRAPP